MEINSLSKVCTFKSLIKEKNRFFVVLLAMFVAQIFVGYSQSLPQMKLKSTEFKNINYNSTEYKPREEDLSILARGLQQRNNRVNSANISLEKLQNVLLEIKAEINDGQETQGWFKEYSDSVVELVNKEMEAGNYSNANAKAISLCGEVRLDPKIIGRIRVNQQYQKEISIAESMLNSGEITEDAFLWWVESNPYKYRDKIDVLGRIVGGEQWKPRYDLRKSIKWDELCLKAWKISKTKTDLLENAYRLNQWENGVGSVLQEYSITEWRLKKIRRWVIRIQDSSEKSRLEKIINQLETLLSYDAPNPKKAYFEKRVLKVFEDLK